MEETRAYVGLCWNLPRSGPVTDPTRLEKGSIDPLSGQCRLRDSAAQPEQNDSNETVMLAA